MPWGYEVFYQVGGEQHPEDVGEEDDQACPHQVVVVPGEGQARTIGYMEEQGRHVYMEETC